MASISDELERILQIEESRLCGSNPHEDIEILIELIRLIDFESYRLEISELEDAPLTLHNYRFGWSLFFKKLYEGVKLHDNVPLFEYSHEARASINQLLHLSGDIETVRQFIDHHKAGLVRLSKPSTDQFQFKVLPKRIDDELADRLSLQYYFSVIEKALADKIKPTIEKLPVIREELKSIVEPFQASFIQYKATDEIDEFYSRLGHIILMTTQIVDDFEETDSFGPYRYKDYLDMAELAMKNALMHRDCCVALSQKTNGKVNLHSIFTYAFHKTAYSKGLAPYMEWSEEKVIETTSALMITKENYEYHLKYRGMALSPYFEIGPETWMRSTQGCLKMPVFFLNRELKRKYPDDYFKAVNRREERFRNQLYSTFSTARIKCVYDIVDIKTTDIDAVVFDTETKTLGLFQLKWQDPYSMSMKEKRNKMTELIPKSVKWIDKISSWLKETSSKSILEKCRIQDDQIGDVFLFVLSRNHVYFTDTKLDERAIWGTWFQLIESNAKVKAPMQQNPIAELALKLKMFYPENRKDMRERKSSVGSTLTIGRYTVEIQP